MTQDIGCTVPWHTSDQKRNYRAQFTEERNVLDCPSNAHAHTE